MINWFKKNVTNRISEEQLIRNVQNGDKEAFGKLYLTYLDRIYRYIFFRVNQDKQAAEDLSEVTFMKAFQSIEKFSLDKGTFQSWLYRIAHNTVLDHYKAFKAMGRVQEDTASVESMKVIEEELDTKQQIESVLAAMKKLTDEQREVITLRFVEGLSHKQIAFVLNKQEDAIRAIQYRGLQSLKKTFTL
jgi:RNA polymerase sigma-70 factor (ECF subfamily)